MTANVVDGIVYVDGKRAALKKKPEPGATPRQAEKGNGIRVVFYHRNTSEDTVRRDGEGEATNQVSSQKWLRIIRLLTADRT